MYTLQKSIIKRLKDKDSFRASSKRMLKNYMKNGITIGAYIKDVLIAYRIIYIPKNRPENLGNDLKFSKKNLRKVYHLETTLVHPQYRQMKLQVLLTKKIQDYIDLKNKILCATCYPFNYPSLSNLFELGLCINAIKYKYNSKIRFILSNKKYTLTGNNIVICSCKKINKIKKLLRNGYISTGVTAGKSIDDFSINFQKGQIS
jgi:hypothetical protein